MITVGQSSYIEYRYINNKNFLEYHRDNCYIKFENIMHSLDKLSEDMKLPCNKCRKRFKSKEDLKVNSTIFYTPIY